MDSVRKRKLLLAVLLPATAVLVVYGFLSPVEGSATASIALSLLTAALLLGVKAAETYDPHQLNLVQEKSYLITLKSVLATSLLTGIVLLAVLYAAAVVIGLVAAFSGYETVSFRLFADAVGRLGILLEVPALQLFAAYAVTALFTGLGFWILYPYLPTESEEVAGPAAFLAAWIYLLSTASMFVSLPVQEPASLALDAALVAFWGHLFALAYEEVEIHVP